MDWPTDIPADPEAITRLFVRLYSQPIPDDSTATRDALVARTRENPFPALPRGVLAEAHVRPIAMACRQGLFLSGGQPNEPGENERRWCIFWMMIVPFIAHAKSDIDWENIIRDALRGLTLGALASESVRHVKVGGIIPIAGAILTTTLLVVACSEHPPESRVYTQFLPTDVAESTGFRSLLPRTRYWYLIDTATRVSAWGWHSLAMGNLSQFVPRSSAIQPITLVYRYQLYPVEQQACRLLGPTRLPHCLRYMSNIVPVEHFSQRALDNWDSTLGAMSGAVPATGFPNELLALPHSPEIIRCLEEQHQSWTPESLDDVSLLPQIIQIHGKEPYFDTLTDRLLLSKAGMLAAIKRAATIVPIIDSMGPSSKHIIEDLFDNVRLLHQDGLVDIDDMLAFLTAVGRSRTTWNATHQCAIDIVRIISAPTPPSLEQVHDAYRQYEQAEPWLAAFALMRYWAMCMAWHDDDPQRPAVGIRWRVDAWLIDTNIGRLHEIMQLQVEAKMGRKRYIPPPLPANDNGISVAGGIALHYMTKYHREFSRVVEAELREAEWSVSAAGQDDPKYDAYRAALSKYQRAFRAWRQIEDDEENADRARRATAKLAVVTAMATCMAELTAAGLTHSYCECELAIGFPCMVANVIQRGLRCGHGTFACARHATEAAHRAVSRYTEQKVDRFLAVLCTDYGCKLGTESGDDREATPFPDTLDALARERQTWRDAHAEHTRAMGGDEQRALEDLQMRYEYEDHAKTYAYRFAPATLVGVIDDQALAMHLLSGVGADTKNDDDGDLCIVECARMLDTEFPDEAPAMRERALGLWSRFHYEYLCSVCPVCGAPSAGWDNCDTVQCLKCGCTFCGHCREVRGPPFADAHTAMASHVHNACRIHHRPADGTVDYGRSALADLVAHITRIKRAWVKYVCRHVPGRADIRDPMTRMLQYLAANAPNTKDGIPSIYYFVNAGKKAPEGMRTAKERREFVLGILGELGDLLEWPVKPKGVNPRGEEAGTSAARRVRPGTPLISAGPGSGSGDGSNHSWASGSGSGSRQSLTESQLRYLRQHGRLPVEIESNMHFRRKYVARPQRAQPDPDRPGRFLQVERPTLPTDYAHYFGAQSNKDIELAGGRQPTGDLLEDYQYRERTPSPQRSLQSTDLVLLRQEYRHLFQSRSPTPAEATGDADATASDLVLAQYGADRAVQQTLARDSSIDTMLGVYHADLLAADDDDQWMPADILPEAGANQQFVDPLDVFGIDTNDGVEEGSAARLATNADLYLDPPENVVDNGAPLGTVPGVVAEVEEMEPHYEANVDFGDEGNNHALLPQDPGSSRQSSRRTTPARDDNLYYVDELDEDEGDVPVRDPSPAPVPRARRGQKRRDDPDVAAASADPPVRRGRGHPVHPRPKRNQVVTYPVGASPLEAAYRASKVGSNKNVHTAKFAALLRRWYAERPSLGRAPNNNRPMVYPIGVPLNGPMTEVTPPAPTGDGISYEELGRIYDTHAQLRQHIEKGGRVDVDTVELV